MNRFLLIAGPNGVGKSTFYTSNSDFQNYKFLNLDKLSASVPDSNELTRQKIAYRKLNENFHNAISKHKDIAQETTLCGHSIIRNIKLARESGYSVSICFIYCDNVETCKRRVAHRVSLGGHNVNGSDIERRHLNSLRALLTNFELFDDVYIYDNSEDFVLIARYLHGELVFKRNHLPGWASRLCEFFKKL